MKQIIFTPNVVSLTFEEFLQDEQNMILQARKATKHAHAPYSNYKVGCAVRLRHGVIISGANQENASYGLSMCAERTTIFSVWNSGHHKDVAKIAVTARPGDIENYIGTKPVAPCGACRQVMKEAEELAGEPLIIILDCYNDSEIIRIVGIESILQLSFGPSDLGIKFTN